MQAQRDTAAEERYIVVVDDDAAVRNSLKFSLEAEGFSVHVFADGQELLRQRALPDCGCLVVDQNLPGICGIDLIASLRERQVSVPAVLITSHPNKRLQAHAAHAGIPIVEKPLLGSTLIDTIRRAMTRAQAGLN